MYKIPCSNCSGQGYIEKFAHVDNGLCFKCHGSKVEEATKEQYDNYIESKKRKQNENFFYVYDKNNHTIEKVNRRDFKEKYNSFWNTAPLRCINEFMLDGRAIDIQTNIKENLVTWNVNEGLEIILEMYLSTLINDKILRNEERIKEEKGNNEYISMLKEFNEDCKEELKLVPIKVKTIEKIIQ